MRLDARGVNGLVGLTAAGLALGALVVAFVVAGAIGSTERGATLLWWLLCLGVLVVPALSALAGVALRGTPLRAGAPAVAGAALLGLLPAVCLAASLTWAAPIVSADEQSCGTGAASLMLGAFFVIVVGVVVAPYLGLAMVRRVDTVFVSVADRAMAAIAALCVLGTGALLAGLTLGVADSIDAPRPLWLCGLIGSLLACLLLGYRWRIAGSLTAVRDARAGVVLDDTIVFDDGELPARVALTQASAAGPALAPRAQTRASVTYRSDGQHAPTQVWSGTRADQTTQLRARSLAVSTLALASATLTLAPLWVIGSSPF